MALKLDGPRRRVAKLASDRVVITRNQQSYARGTMDPVTLVITPAVAEQVYDGMAFITPDGRQASTQTVGGNDGAIKTYNCALPFSDPAADIRPGDDLKVVSSEDPALVGRSFKIQDVKASSVVVWRRMSMVALETSRG